MKIKSKKSFWFEAAHKLPNNVGSEGKLHGHNWVFSVTVEGTLNDRGRIKEFGEFEQLVRDKIWSELDKDILNDFLPNPTCENVAIWIWTQLKEVFGDAMVELELFEDERNSVVIGG